MRKIKYWYGMRNDMREYEMIVTDDETDEEINTKIREKMEGDLRYGFEEIDRMSAKKLLPCPFCGGKAYFSDTNWINCDTCNTHTSYFDNAEDAIKAWNKRKPMERIVERLDRMKSKPIELCYDVLLIDSIIEIVKEEGELND